MNELRLSTVFDLASLRLHPDGTRVQQSSRNLRPRVSKGSVRDSRGNWIARDAGGVAAVSKYKKVRDEPAEPEECEDIGQNEHNLDDDESKLHENLRPAKRRKFNQDYDFLASTSSPKSSLHTSAQQQCDTPLPPPSSDLLKSIHHFAAQYYSERGQLLDNSRQYRKEKKARRLKRQQVAGEKSRSGSLVGESISEEREADSEDSAEFLEDGNPDIEEIDVKRKKKKTYSKDMYKVFDGSALMAMAIFVQEHVARLLEFHIPEGWEETIRKLYEEGFSDDEREDIEILEDEEQGTGYVPEQGHSGSDDAHSEQEDADEDHDENDSRDNNSEDNVDDDDDDDDEDEDIEDVDEERDGDDTDDEMVAI